MDFNLGGKSFKVVCDVDEQRRTLEKQAEELAASPDDGS